VPTLLYIEDGARVVCILTNKWTVFKFWTRRNKLMPTVADRKRPIYKHGVVRSKVVLNQQYDPDQDNTYVETFDIGEIAHNFSAAIHAVQIWPADLGFFVIFAGLVAIFGMGCAVWGTAALRHYTKTADNVAVAVFHAIMAFSIFSTVLCGLLPGIDYIKHWWNGRHVIKIFRGVKIFQVIVALMFMGFFFWWALGFQDVYSVLPKYWWVMLSTLFVLMICTICVAMSVVNWVHARTSIDAYRNTFLASLNVAERAYVAQRIGAQRIAAQIQPSAASAATIGGSVEMAGAAPLLTPDNFPRVGHGAVALLRATGRMAFSNL
jgi:hypothetical protein